jgi:hypothetical protein
VHTLTVGRLGSGAGAVTSLPAGISCGAACGSAYEYGTVVTLTATPVVSSTFAGWSGACASANACVVTLNQPSAVTATFALKSYTVTVVLAGTGSGVITSTPAGVLCGLACAASFTYGTALTLTAAPTAGSDFAGWARLCGGAGACGLVVTQPVTITATFNLQPPQYTTYLPMITKGVAHGTSRGARGGPEASAVIWPESVRQRRREGARAT